MVTKLNTSLKQVDRNIKQNCKRNLPWLDSSHEIFKGEIAIVAGAPSIKDKINEIKHLPKETLIMSVNGSHDFLVDNGIKPDFFAMVDARPVNKFARHNIQETIYLLASQCHRSVFERFKDNRVILWHAEYEEMDKEYIEKQALKKNLFDCSYISGKGTIGLTAICLAYTLGFRAFKLYGLDSSFTGYQHAYTQKQNEQDSIIEVNGYKTTKPLLNQVLTYIELKKLLSDCRIDMRSSGLINESKIDLTTIKEISNG